MKWLILLTLVVVITPAAFAEIPETPQVIQTIGPNYDLTEDYFNGLATWQSHAPRIMFEGQWSDFAVIESDTSIQVASNSIGSLVYSKNNCSYSIYENGYVSSDKRIIPSVSWMPRIAEVGTNNYSEMTDLFNQQCTVSVHQGEDWVKITSVKTQTEDLPPLVVQHLNGTSSTYSQGITQVATTTQTLDFRTDNGIKETVSVFNGNPEWSNHKFALTQTVHTGDTITLADQTYDVAAASGTVLDRQWIENNEAEIFEIADSLSYDFDVGFEQFNALQVIDDNGTYKVALDYSVNESTPYLSSYTVDPTFTATLSSNIKHYVDTTNASNVGSTCLDGVDSSGSSSSAGEIKIGGQDCNITQYTFDVSSLPSGIITSSVDFTATATPYSSGGYATSSQRNCDITDVDTSQSAGLDMFTYIARDASTLYSSDQSWCKTSGSHTVSLSNTPDFSSTSTFDIGVRFVNHNTKDSSSANCTGQCIQSEFSSVGLGITYALATQPSAPANLSAVSGIPIALDWDASTDLGGAATGDMTYKVERSGYEFSESPLPINAGSDTGVNMSTNKLLYHLDEVEAVTTGTTPTSTPLTSSSGWSTPTDTAMQSIDHSTGIFDWKVTRAGSSDMMYLDYGTTLDEDWTLRWTHDLPARSNTNGNYQSYICISENNVQCHSGGTYSNGNKVGMTLNFNTNTGDANSIGQIAAIWGTTHLEQNWSIMNYHFGNGGSSGQQANAEIVHFQLEFDSGSYTLTAYSDNTFSAGSLLGTSTGTVGSAWTNLQYILFHNIPDQNNGYTADTDLYDFTIYDGVLSSAITPQTTSYFIEDTSGANNDSENPNTSTSTTVTLSTPSHDGSQNKSNNGSTCTGSPTGGSISASNYIDGGSSGNPCYRTYMEWDISSISDSATITSVSVIYNISANNGAIYDIYSMETTTANESNTSTALWDDMTDGDLYADDQGGGTGSVTIDLGATAATNLQSDLASKDVFGIGLSKDPENSGSRLYKAFDAAESSTPPQLVITYGTSSSPTFSSGNIANQIDDPLLTVKSTSLYDGTDSHTVGGWSKAVASATGTMLSFENTAGETISYEVEADKLRVAKSGITTLPTDFSDDFTTDKGWVSTDGQYVIDTTTDNRVEYAVQRTNQGSSALHFLKDLQDADALNGSNLDNEKFVLRFKLTSDSVTGSGSHDAWFNFGLYSSTSNITIAEDFLGLDFKQNNAGSGSQNMRFGTSDNAESYSQSAYTDTSLWMNGSDEWYMEIVRTASDSAVLRIFSDDTYSGTPAHEFNLSFGTDDPQDLRYLGGKVYGSNSNPTYVFGGVFDDVQVWDGVTSASGTTKTNIIEATGQTISTSTPSHIQFNRGTVNDWSIYLDGASVATATDSTSLGTANSLSPLIHYDFEQTGSTLTNQGTASSADGTNNGATTGSTGILGSSWDFDGSNDYVNTSTNALSSTHSAFTLMGWLKPSSTATTYALCLSPEDGNTNNFHCVQTKSNGVFQATVGDNSVQTSCNGSTSYSTSAWSHVAVQYDGSSTKLFVDGVLDCTSSSTPSGSYTQDTKVNLARQGTSGQTFYGGLIDQVLVFDTAISADTVSEIYNSGNGLSSFAPSYYIGQSPTGTNALPSLDEFYIFTSDKSGEASDIYDRGSNQFTQVGSTTGSDTDHDDNSSLVSGTTYYHRIIANNGAFDSEPSNVTTSTAGTPPDAPSITSITIDNPNPSPLDITLAWQNGSSMGTGSFTNYIVTRSSDSTFTTSQNVGTPTAATITDTVPSAGTWYYKVSTQSSHGGSANSAASNITTPTVPTAPGLSLAINDPHAYPLIITSTFTAPSSDGGSSLTGYNLFHSTDDATYNSIAAGVTGNYNHTATNSGTHYFQAEAVNNVGASVKSTSYSIATPTVPAAITDLGTNVISNVQIDLSWSAPNNGGSNIVQYKILRDSINVANTTSASYSDSSLSDNTSYLFNVFAQNNVGTSTTSNSQSATTHTGVTGGITGSATIIGATSQLTINTSVTGGTPTPTFNTFVVKEGSDIIGTFTGTTGYLHLLDESTHTYTVESTDTTHWQQPTISGTISGVTGQYAPTWENNAAYNVTRGGGVFDLTVNRDTAAGWDLDCEYRTSTQAAANNTGVHGVGSNMWAYSDTQSIPDGKHVYVTCLDGSDEVVSFTSYGPNLITGGLNMLDTSFGDFLGAPAAVLFIILIAGLFTGRTANTGILVVLALIGVLGFIGMIAIDEATWGFILIAGVLGLFVGRRFL